MMQIHDDSNSAFASFAIHQESAPEEIVERVDRVERPGVERLDRIERVKVLEISDEALLVLKRMQDSEHSCHPDR